MSDAHKYTTIARRRQIAALHADGLTNVQIGQRLGISKIGVAQHLTKLGLAANLPPATTARDVTLHATPWDATCGTPRPETAPRDGTMIGGHVPRDDLAGVMAAIRAAHRAHVEARA